MDTGTQVGLEKRRTCGIKDRGKCVDLEEEFHNPQIHIVVFTDRKKGKTGLFSPQLGIPGRHVNRTETQRVPVCLA